MPNSRLRGLVLPPIGDLPRLLGHPVRRGARGREERGLRGMKSIIRLHSKPPASRRCSRGLRHRRRARSRSARSSRNIPISKIARAISDRVDIFPYDAGGIDHLRVYQSCPRQRSGYQFSWRGRRGRGKLSVGRETEQRKCLTCRMKYRARIPRRSRLLFRYRLRRPARWRSLRHWTYELATHRDTVSPSPPFCVNTINTFVIGSARETDEYLCRGAPIEK